MNKIEKTDSLKTILSNVHLNGEDDGTVWTYVLSMHMPAVFLTFSNCVGSFNDLHGSVKRT